MTGPAQTVPRRPPAQVMTLSRLGSFHQCRLSFVRILTRRMAEDGWSFTRPEFQIDGSGVGHAVYSAIGPARSYSLVAFAHDLPDAQRSDRVIAEAWDATFVLFDGVPTADDITRLGQNVPQQETGRITETELTLSRANRSVRLWEHVVSALAMGEQPDAAMVSEIGYLMRTTAVYGSGKFGAADREKIADRPEMQVPFQAEMLTVYLIRTFVRDMVNHMAQVKGGAQAVPLAPQIARQLGIGNSTGLGMAPFIVNHPVLFNNWIVVREEALARVRSIERPTRAEIDTFLDILARSEVSISRWTSAHPLQIEKLARLRNDLGLLRRYIEAGDLTGPSMWDSLVTWSQSALSEEGQELIVSLVLEPYGPLIDGMAHCMADNGQASCIDGAMPISRVKALLKHTFGWALDVNWDDPENCARAWYVSAEKLEPRLGERFEEPVADYEQPLAPARDAAKAHAALEDWPSETAIADFLIQHPEHRHTIRRAQVFPRAPYGEINGNTIGADVLPIDMLRAKLSFFGATHFDPRSDRWVRICMYAGAPYPEDLQTTNADTWVYPELTA
ncbi:MAG: hypothetical protein MK160_08735 [Rhodobacteraceae bacterium]|nr:hypothetical protein [Paracoccaceae bacterium]